MRARFVQGVTPAQQEALVGTVRNNRDATLVRRCQAIVLSTAGQTIPAIARLMGVDASTIHRWLDRFEAGGIGALSTEWSDGRPMRWDEAYELLLVETARGGTDGNSRPGRVPSWPDTAPNGPASG